MLYSPQNVAELFCEKTEHLIVKQIQTIDRVKESEKDQMNVNAVNGLQQKILDVDWSFVRCEKQQNGYHEREYKQQTVHRRVPFVVELILSSPELFVLGLRKAERFVVTIFRFGRQFECQTHPSSIQVVVLPRIQMIENYVQADDPEEHNESGQTDEAFDVHTEKVVRTADEQLHGIGSLKKVGHTDLHTERGFNQKDRIVFETKAPGAFKASAVVVVSAVD